MKVAPYTMLLVGMAVVTVLLGAAGIAGGVSATCVGCHTQHADRWSSSAHSGVKCFMCHQRPGPLGVFEQRARMLVMIRSAVAPREHERTAVPNAHCMTCHRAIAAGVIESNGIRVRHSDIIGQGRWCTECHNTVTHGDTVVVARGPAMDDCMRCHDADPARGECDVCHVPGVKRVRSEIQTAWQITHSVTWRYTHGLGDRATCRTCHPPGYCVRCHGVDLPHPPAWNNTHGATARRVPQSCDPCHQQDLCSGCHTTDMPHADGFLPAHSVQAAGEGRQGCLECHIEASCDACHVAHIHPGLTPAQIEALRAGVRR